MNVFTILIVVAAVPLTAQYLTNKELSELSYSGKSMTLDSHLDPATSQVSYVSKLPGHSGLLFPPLLSRELKPVMYI